jgi:putative flippase GtrA
MERLRSNKLARYVFVGGLAYVVEMAVLYGLRNALGLDAVLAVAISFWVGFVAAFLLQKYVAFQHHDGRAHVVVWQLIIYSALVGWNFSFTLLVAYLFGASTSIFVLRTVVILIVTVWNFAVYRILFREQIKGGHPNTEEN